MVGKLSDIPEGDERKDFEFAEKQLGVIDLKAQNVIFIDSVLIIIATLSIVFHRSVPAIVSDLTTLGTILVLSSAGLCIRTIWTKWATDLVNVDGVIKLRDNKTKYLHASLIILIVALGVYVIMFAILDLYTNNILM